MQVELTERYGLPMAHILATGATPRLHWNTSNAAFAHGCAIPNVAWVRASTPEPWFPPAGRGVAGEITHAYAGHRRKLAVWLDVESGQEAVPAASRRGLRRQSVEGIGAAMRAFASHPAASRSS
jgi:hypothetical protein